MSRRSTILPKSAERRSTPTTVRASGFERSGDNSTACAKARPRVSVQAEGKDEGDPTLARPVRQSALSRSDPRRCREGCNPHPAVPSPAPARKVIRQGALRFRVAIGPQPSAQLLSGPRSAACPRGRPTKPEQCGARSVSGQTCAHLPANRGTHVSPALDGLWRGIFEPFLVVASLSGLYGGDHGQRTCEGRRGQG